MAVGCGPNMAKIFLIIFNIIFWLSGAALLGVGIWLLVDPNVTNTLTILSGIQGSGELMKYTAYVLIAVGAFVLIVGFFGCCGAIKESRVMLGIYIVLLVIIMGLEIAAGVLAILYKDQIIQKVTDELGTTFKEKYALNKTDEDRGFTQALNIFQKEFKCCGIEKPEDYRSLPSSRSTVPLSCCVLKDTAKSTSANKLIDADAVDPVECLLLDADYHKLGCTKALQGWIKKHATILIGVGIGIACLELFGFIFAVCLCRNVGDEE